MEDIRARNRSGGLHLVTGTGKTLTASRLIDEPARAGRAFLIGDDISLAAREHEIGATPQCP